MLSTKVGRLLTDKLEDTSTRDLGEKSGLFQYGLANKAVYDYTADGTLRAIEASLKVCRVTISTMSSSTTQRSISTATSGRTFSRSPWTALPKP